MDDITKLELDIDADEDSVATNQNTDYVSTERTPPTPLKLPPLNASLIAGDGSGRDELYDDSTFNSSPPLALTSSRFSPPDPPLTPVSSSLSQQHQNGRPTMTSTPRLRTPLDSEDHVVSEEDDQSAYMAKAIDRLLVMSSSSESAEDTTASQKRKRKMSFKVNIYISRYIYIDIFLSFNVL